jgi:hypothetical protein
MLQNKAHEIQINFAKSGDFLKTKSLISIEFERI